jgi:serine/threonine protein kinase
MIETLSSYRYKPDTVTGIGIGGPAREIPTPPEMSLSYDDITGGEVIGKGGNADVYRVTVQRGGEEIPIAVKQPRMQGTLTTETVERFIEEAEVWENLDSHDHIVGLFDWGTEPLPWLAMEFMDGGSLGHVLPDDGLPPAQAAWVGICVCRAVRHAHRHGVAHHDIKPANVLFREVQEGWLVPKVSDWGLARMLLVESGSVDEMSPHYAAPEQFDANQYGSPDDRTDIYQIGTLLYELFTGRPPFEGAPASVMQGVLNEQPNPPSAVASVPDQVDEIVARALAKPKDERYESVVYLRDELETLFKTLQTQSDGHTAVAGAMGETHGDSDDRTDKTDSTPDDGPAGATDESVTPHTDRNHPRTAHTGEMEPGQSGGEQDLPVSRRQALGALGVLTVGGGSALLLSQGDSDGMGNGDGTTGGGSNGGGRPAGATVSDGAGNETDGSEAGGNQTDGNETGNGQGDDPEPAEIALSGLDIGGQGTDATVEPGATADVAVDVENTGGTSGTFDVTLTAGSESASQTVDLDAGETQTLTFPGVVEQLGTGTSDIVVGTGESEVMGTVTVESEGDGPTAEFGEYTDWLYAPSVIGNRPGYFFGAVDDTELRANEQFFASSYNPATQVSSFPFAPMGVGYEAIDTRVNVGFTSTVVAGSFDEESVLSTLADNGFEEDRTYSGYTVTTSESDSQFGGTQVIAVNGSIAVTDSGGGNIGPNPQDSVEAIIDASQGNVERYAEADEDMALVVDEFETYTNLLGQTQEPPQETNIDEGQLAGQVATGQSIIINGETTDLTAVIVFANQSAVDTDAIEEIVSNEPPFSTADDTAVSASGRTARITATVDTETYTEQLGSGSGGT